MQLHQLLEQLPAEVIIEYTGRAAQVEFNPAARWISRILVAELARRQGEPQPPIEPLRLQPDEQLFAVEWLDAAADKYLDTGLDHGIAGMVLLGGLLAHLRKAVVLRAASITH